MTEAEVVLQRNLDKLHREMGPIISAAMKDPSVVEVMLNADGRVWVDQLGVGMSELCTLDSTAALQMLGTIAHMLGSVINETERPKVEGELPGDGSRIEGVIPPLVEAPVFNIRKKASAVFPLSAYVKNGRATAEDHAIMTEAVVSRKNILIVGGTGTGKTTFANAILHEMYLQCPKHRPVILEDTVELQCALENKVRMKTCEELEITMQDLLKIAMRQRPDRIIVGEVRGREALDMLKAWNTGHPGGLCTVHANDARAGLVRIEQLVAESGILMPMKHLIAEAVNIVVFLVRDPEIGPKISEIIAIEGVMNEEYIFRDMRTGCEKRDLRTFPALQEKEEEVFGDEERRQAS